ncbi:hypothetical protein M422DRAFT_239360 [Sphaerobolus stellatus SS14]|nr:hypothetical protein M422DRAFT_239360 [Sphaerobolus stellatus SS14]
MSHKQGITRRARAEELSVQAVGNGEPSPGLTTGNLVNSPSPSVDPQQRPEMLAPEHPSEPHATASDTAHQGSASPRGVAGASDTATQGSYSPQGIGLGSGSWQNLSDVTSDPEQVSLDEGDTDEGEDFIIPASEENTEIVIAEAMEATERVNMVFTQIRASMNRMSLRMKELLIVPSKKVSGKTHEPGNNRVHDKAAAKAATE